MGRTVGIEALRDDGDLCLGTVSLHGTHRQVTFHNDLSRNELQIQRERDCPLRETPACLYLVYE